MRKCIVHNSCEFCIVSSTYKHDGIKTKQNKTNRRKDIPKIRQEKANQNKQTTTTTTTTTTTKKKKKTTTKKKKKKLNV